MTVLKEFEKSELQAMHRHLPEISRPSTRRWDAHQRAGRGILGFPEGLLWRAGVGMSLKALP